VKEDRGLSQGCPSGNPEGLHPSRARYRKVTASTAELWLPENSGAYAIPAADGKRGGKEPTPALRPADSRFTPK